jgi:hypothetical protein
MLDYWAAEKAAKGPCARFRGGWMREEAAEDESMNVLVVVCVSASCVCVCVSV